MLKNLSIKVRLIFVVSFLSVLLALFGTVGLVSLQLTNSGLRSLYEDRLVALGQLSQVTSAASAGRYAIATAIVGSGEDMDKYLELLSRTLADGDKVWAEYLQTYLTPEETQLAQQFDTDYKKFIAEGVKPAMAALHNRDFQGATNLYNGPLLKLFRELNVSMNKLTALQQDVGKQLYQDSQARYQTFLVITIAAIAIGLSVALIMGIWLVRAISGPLNLAVKVARGVADGDLTQVIEVHSHDEAGQLMEALRTMNGRLQQIVGEVRVSTDTISTASAEIASGNMDLSSRTESQAGSLEETASAMEELTSTVKQNADNARQANQLAASASEIAIEGGNVVGKVVETMNNINDSSKKIVDIISVIDGIAFQTNILALNAAVEAARAGEQGRGFAVVASEVRSLAQRSAAAAKEIKTLIDDSVQKVSEGSKLVEQAGVTMDGVVSSVKRVTDVMGEITAASQEQSSGIEEVNRAITQMDETTQQNAALVEQAAAAAQSLQDQAQRLTHAVSVFKLDGKRAAVSVPAAPAKKATVKATVAAAPAAVAAVTTAVTKPAAPAVRKTVVAKPVKPVVKPAASPASAAVKPSEDDWEQF